ncbi:hypothetical protein PHMEG_00018237 [Phytophthora megakarya]|uniref:SET domain-containing protein n=1 Tax=Phytophthora megakarya TaxID=4795 RepID=A0A225VUU0_9STRA|nr:hypothetical protein PHMEG_00018237 [Phytophthora megakarya]
MFDICTVRSVLFKINVFRAGGVDRGALAFRRQAVKRISHWRFLPVSIGINGGAGRGCATRCNAFSCLNASENRFCEERNCAFAGACGNSLQVNPSLVIARNKRTGLRGLVATSDIVAGEVIGKYLGQLDLFGPPCRNGPANDGYRMHLKTRTTRNKHIGLDAKEAGGVLRFFNHSCNPCARFHEVQTGERLTVVAVTIRDVAAEEHVTVSYGDRLWFVCRVDVNIAISNI